MTSSRSPRYAPVWQPLLALVVAGTAGCGLPDLPECGDWLLKEQGEVLAIFHQDGTTWPQVAAFHRDSGYLRLNHGKGSGWGTSVVVVPSFWSGGKLHQGAKTTLHHDACTGKDLRLNVSATLSGLTITGHIRLHPPKNHRLTAEVNLSSLGKIKLDSRPDEAFKPLMLSSMRISKEQWDSSTAQVGGKSYEVPFNQGKFIQPAVTTTQFSLLGGSPPGWTKNTPTMEVTLDAPLPVTGYVAASMDPNDDNVGLWPASTQVLPTWSYTITARPWAWAAPGP